MKTAGVGGGRARALTAEEAGTGWPALLSVPATRLYCPSTDDRTDLGQRPACDSSSRPYCPGLRSNKGKQTHAGVDFLCFQAVISFCVTLRVCDCHTHEGFLGVVSAGFLGDALTHHALHRCHSWILSISTKYLLCSLSTALPFLPGLVASFSQESPVAV